MITLKRITAIATCHKRVLFQMHAAMLLLCRSCCRLWELSPLFQLLRVFFYFVNLGLFWFQVTSPSFNANWWCFLLVWLEKDTHPLDLIHTFRITLSRKVLATWPLEKRLALTINFTVIDSISRLRLSRRLKCSVWNPIWFAVTVTVEYTGRKCSVLLLA